VFQPHLFSRTKDFLHEFAVSFADADQVILAPIFASRETFDPSITSDMLALEVKKKGKEVKVGDTFEKIIEYLKKNIKKGDVVMTIGAGDIYKVGESLIEKK
jgi:UDP-N-acetylmuramate--alanine ligase